MKPFLKKTLFGFAGLVLTSYSAMAAWTFNDADLIIGFQAAGGTGASTNLFYNVGDSYDFANGTGNYGLLGNINDDLVATYGSGWASRTDLYFGAIANRSNLTATLVPAIPGEADAGRVIYVSAATTTVGGSNLRAAFANSSLGTTAVNYGGMKTNVLFGATETANNDGVISLNQSLSPTAWNNSWTVRNPGLAGAAFGNLTGGIQQSFGKAGTENIIDIQRIGQSNTSGGTSPFLTEIVGSIVIGDDGSISAVPETSSSILSIMIGSAAVLRRRRNRVS